MKATTNRRYFNELMKNPLFFMEQKKYESIEKQNLNCIEIEDHYFNKSTQTEFGQVERLGKIEDHYFYKSTQTEISAFIFEEKIVNEILHLEYVLLVAENEVEDVQEESSDSVTFSFHIANPQYDWIFIINSLIIRSQNSEDKFPFKYILWFLNHSNWNVKQLISAIGQYDIKVQPYILKWLQKICRCLSYQKQEKIKEVAHYFNFEYKIYFPSLFTDALKYVTPIISGTNCNLFDLIDYILGDTDEIYYSKDGNIIHHEVNTESSNDFICLYKWFISDKPLKDYQLLKSIYSLVSHERQLKIIQRYFHDVRLANVGFDVKIVEQFRDNNYREFMRYRYCINTPDCKINIGNQLLCDCILTLNETHGKSFQSFNGILDFVINHCDVTNPKIDLGLDSFLPCCNGGAVYNDAFVGFIDYSIIVSLDDNKITSENLKRTIISILELSGNKKGYITCRYDSNAKPLVENSKCLKLSKLLNLGKLDCIIPTTYEDRWVVPSEKADRLNLFVNKPLDSTNKDIEIALSDVSVEKMKESIYNIASNYKNGDSETYIINSRTMDSFECKLLLEYSVPRSMRIYPQEKVYIGPLPQVKTRLKSYRNSFFDPLNIKELLSKDLNNEDFLKEFRKKESLEVMKRVVSTLNTILNDSIYNGVYFETEYNKSLLGKLRRLYYYKKIVNIDNKDFKHSFLKKKTLLSWFCAPKLAEVHNQATDLPFFWCGGNECFRNNLDKQCLQNNSSWTQYTLFHFAEIIGYPKLHQIECGYEPDGIISLFIVVANKAMKKFGRLKCRACGHLMYPVKRDNFDRNNYYSCINPTCSEYEKAVYLNYCYRCKKGLIDSRDTKQCPNGWYICPICLSCCDDKQYERLAQRYVVSHLPIPNHIQSKLGKGHNDKGFYFCPVCGSELDITYDNSNCFSAYCKSCNKIFNVSDINKLYH